MLCNIDYNIIDRSSLIGLYCNKWTMDILAEFKSRTRSRKSEFESFRFADMPPIDNRWGGITLTEHGIPTSCMCISNQLQLPDGTNHLLFSFFLYYEIEIENISATGFGSWLRDRSKCSWHSFRPVLLSWTWCIISIDTKSNSIDPASSEEASSVHMPIHCRWIWFTQFEQRTLFRSALVFVINLINLRFLQFIANTQTPLERTFPMNSDDALLFHKFIYCVWHTNSAIAQNMFHFRNRFRL